MKTHFDKWCYFLKNLENFDSIPDILNEEIFVKAFEVAKLSEMEKGMEKKEIKIVIAAYKKGYTVVQINDFTDIPLERVSWIIQKYEDQLEAKLIDETADMLLDTEENMAFG